MEEVKLFSLVLIASCQLVFAQNPDIPANQMDVVIQPTVSFDHSVRAFIYNYGIFSKPDSVQNVWDFTVEFFNSNARPFGGKEPSGWLGPDIATLPEGGPTEIAPSNAIGWHAELETDDILPGHFVQGFSFSSYGFPGIVRSWTQGDVPPEPPVSEVPQDAPFIDPYSSFENVILKTVGPDILPGALTNAQLLDRVIGLKEQAAGLGWIDNKGVANSLDKKLEAAKDKLQSGEIKTAANILHAFIHDLQAQHRHGEEDEDKKHERGESEREDEKAKHVNDNGFYLLEPNAEYIFSKLEPAGESHDHDKDKDQDGKKPKRK